MKRKAADRGTAVLAATYRRGAGLRYDLPPEAVEHMRRAHLLKNEMRRLYRRIDRAARLYKALGGEQKVAREHFTAKWGDPRKYATWKDRRREIGVGSATASELVKAYAEANDRIVKARVAGDAAEFKFKPWLGEGMLYRQIQGLDSGGVAVRRAESGEGPLRIERAGKHAVFHVTVEGVRLSVPIPNYYREQANGKNAIPADAVVTAVRVVRETVASKPRVSISVSYWTPAPALKTAGVPVSVVVGWASEGDGRWTTPDDGDRRRYVPGSVLVAKVSSPLGPLPDVVADGVWRLLLERDESIRAHRDELLDEIRPLVVTALREQPDVVADVRFSPARSRSHRRFRWLARSWPQDHPLAGKLAAWRSRDLHLEGYECNERDQVIASRRDYYRNAAARICEVASEILLDVPPVARTRQKPDDDSHEARAGRSLVQFAAPAEFASALRNAARMRGINVIEARKEAGDG